MNISEAGITLIKQAEGFRSTVYTDGVGLPTIGFGHKVLNGEDFYKGITEGQADALLRTKDAPIAVAAVNRMLHVVVQQCVFDALCSLAYNMGGSKISTSTMVQMINAGQLDEACDQLYYEDASGGKHGWIYAGGKIEAGLIVRRKAEQALWRSV